MDKKIGEWLVRFLMLTGGSLVFAAGISLFLNPSQLAPGGTSGIAIIINYVTNIKTGTLILIMNIPILLYGWIKFGPKLILATGYVTLLSSLAMNYMESYVKHHELITKDPFLAGAAGGTLMAIGMGMVFRNGGTTGGSDILVKALRQKMPHIKTGTIYLVSDVIIIAASALVFHNVEVALYAAMSVVISNFVLDAVLYNSDGAKLLYIISDHSDQIADRILKELDIGLTNLKAEGGYEKQEKKVLMCVTRKTNYARIREIVRKEDKEAFLIVTGASEVFGYGYKDHFMEEI